jgi:hypothetical protein
MLPLRHRSLLRRQNHPLLLHPRVTRSLRKATAQDQKRTARKGAQALRVAPRCEWTLIEFLFAFCHLANKYKLSMDADFFEHLCRLA